MGLLAEGDDSDCGREHYCGNLLCRGEAVCGCAFLELRDRVVRLPFPVIGILIVFPLYKSYVWEAEAKRYMAEGGHDAPFESMYVESSSSSSMHRRSTAADLFPRRPSNFEVAVNERLENGEPTPSRGMPKLELGQVLVHPAGRVAFITFCKLELNHESVLFFLDSSQVSTLCWE